MSEVTKQDIHEVHTRMDMMVSHQNQTNIELAKIATELKLLPKPADRPCHFHITLKEEVETHLEEHAETTRQWRTPIIKAVIDVAKLVAVAVFTYLWTKKN